VCLVIDSLQLGEIAALHHGTYREQRWWWHSRGYTPAGVECLNGIRAIDYLVSRDDVDPRQVAVTGISGGGAASFWIAAADERVAVAVPVSGMADLPSYVGNRVINGHCDCMFLHNAFSWPWTRIAGLVAPRPLLFVNSDHDGIFPMDANDRVIARLERVYRLYGAGDMVDSVISIGGHAYREDIRKAAYRFVNLHLKNDSRLVVDSEVDLVSESNQPGRYAIEPTRLRVFPTDADLPADQLNTRIDELFVPLAAVELPSQEHFSDWQRALRAELRRVALRRLPDRIPAATVSEPDDEGPWWLATEEGIRVRLRRPEQDAAADAPRRVVLVVAGTDGEAGESTVEEQLAWFARFRQPGDQVYSLEPRGVGATRWTSKNPPNYVERSHVLVGQTVDTGRIRDIVAAARYLKQSHESLPVVVAGRGAAAVLAAYAGMLEQEIDALVADTPPLSHMQAGAPQVLNALRVCDVPHVVGMCAPRPLTLRFDSDVPDSEKRQFTDTVSSIYAAAGATPDL
jgi:dienelactone hydrolase